MLFLEKFSNFMPALNSFCITGWNKLMVLKHFKLIIDMSSRQNPREKKSRGLLTVSGQIIRRTCIIVTFWMSVQNRPHK